MYMLQRDGQFLFFFILGEITEVTFILHPSNLLMTGSSLLVFNDVCGIVKICKRKIRLEIIIFTSLKEESGKGKAMSFLSIL